jgi:hypothetical protein
MTLLPSPLDLASERDPSKRMLALVEPATDMLIRATALNEVNEIRAQASAIERYAKAIKLSTEAIGAAQTIARRAEVRIGQLSGPRQPGGRGKPSLAKDGLSRDQRHQNRILAENAPTVEEVLGDLAPEGKATRAAVLRAVKREGLERAGEQMATNRDQRPIADLLDLERALRLALAGMQKMKGYGQDFGLAPLARRLVSLCHELEGLLDVHE